MPIGAGRIVKDEDIAEVCRYRGQVFGVGTVVHGAVLSAGTKHQQIYKQISTHLVTKISSLLSTDLVTNIKNRNLTI